MDDYLDIFLFMVFAYTNDIILPLMDTDLAGFRR